ncbi:hypothetical protein GEMRC1_007081 [Eukaryota sp. GEM-RC1]
MSTPNRLRALRSKLSLQKRDLEERPSQQPTKIESCTTVPCGRSTTEVPAGDIVEEEFVVLAPVAKKRIIREPFERIVEVTSPVSEEEAVEESKIIEMPMKRRSSSS